MELSGADKVEGVVDIDHGENSPTCGYQSSNGQSRTQELIDELVAANDSAYIPEWKQNRRTS